MPVAVIKHPSGRPADIARQFASPNQPELSGAVGRSLTERLRETHEQLLGAAKFWLPLETSSGVVDSVTPAPKQTFRVTATVPMAGRVRPAPLALDDDELNDAE